MALLASANSTGLAVVSAVSIVGGFALLAAMWHFIFSPRNRHDDDLDRAARQRPDERP
ncbi:MAG: hypothetical protein NVSMB51_19200 [Solirubrobacteraceae bacterium]